MSFPSLKSSSFLAFCLFVATPAQSIFANTDASEAERIAQLEQRVLALEKRLASAEQETKEVKVLASNSVAEGSGRASALGNTAAFDIIAGSAWRNLRWTQSEQWEGIKRGITEEEVIELLGYPPRSVDSLKPRVDRVFWYETSIRDRSSAMSGKVSFKDGRVISFRKPDFDAASRNQPSLSTVR
jgi:hypothetical protein